MIRFNYIIATLLSSSLFWTTTVARAQSIRAEELMETQGNLRQEISKALEDEATLKELKKLGIEKTEVEMRLAGMSDQELQQVKQGVQRQVGGDVIVIGVSTILLLVIIIILLVK